MILNILYHGYCSHKNSRYREIAISIETLGGKKICQVIFYFFIEFFFFTQQTNKDTNKHRA